MDELCEFIAAKLASWLSGELDVCPDPIDAIIGQEVEIEYERPSHPDVFWINWERADGKKKSIQVTIKVEEYK